MNTQKLLITSLVLGAVFAIPAIVLSQADQSKAQAHRDASIKRMQQRAAEIESEMKEAEQAHAQALGEEAFNLFGQIDQTFLQMKKAYQQQVIELNLRMQRKWEQVESAGIEDRASIDATLELLEKDWDRTFDRLTKAHESHLKQLGDSLAKLQGELSKATGRAKAELEASNFEAVARWERGYDFVLALNQTYVMIVNDQLRSQQKKLLENPADQDLAKRITKIRTRHANVQKRFRQRLVSHIEHLDQELETRQAQLKATDVWDTRREIMAMADKLYTRTDTLFEMLQASYRDVYQAYASEMILLPSYDEQVEELAASIKETMSTLSDSYHQRVKFIDQQIADLDARIKKGASVDEQATWKAKMTDLRLLARALEIKAAALTDPPMRTVRR